MNIPQPFQYQGSKRCLAPRILDDEFVEGLDELNRKGVRLLVSYDGRLGDKSYGEPLPDFLDLVLIEIEAGRSSQATLLGQESITVESLYLSRTLAAEVGASPAAALVA